MKPCVLAILCFVFTFQSHAADYYWVGGGGNWSDLNHWRLGSSAGPIASIVPSTGDNVFFDANSGFGTTTATRTVTLDGNGFCNNITWSNVPNNPIFNTANSVFTVEVWGNMTLSPTTSYTCLFKFRGTTPATITTKGTVQGAFGFEIDKPGSSLAVADSLIVPYFTVVPTSFITLTAGTFNIAGKKVAHLRFLSDNTNARTLEMTNANVTFPYYYNFRGANKTLNASGSTLYAGGWIYTDGGTYPRVFNDAYANNSTISNTSMGSLTFRNASAPLSLGINDGNTIDSLTSMGSVSIGSNNNIKMLIAAGGVSAGNNNQIDTLRGPAGVTIGSNNTIPRVISGGHDVMGTGNTIGFWQNGGQFTVSGTGTNIVDSLLLTPGMIIKFSGTFNVNKYLKLDGTNCDAFSEVSGDSVNGSLNFAAGATAIMNNMTLTGLKAFGPITPLAVAGIDNGGNAGFTITAPAAASGTRYWVGGAGDWNDRNHWSTTSGGTVGACVPYIGDDVVFDANSGFAPGNNTVTTSSSTYCHNMTWATGVGTATFTESGAYTFRIYGSLVMQPAATLNAYMEFQGSEPASITTNGSTAGGLQLIIDKSSGAVVTLSDNWSNPAGGSFVHRSGGLNLSGRTVNVVYYSSRINAPRSVDISNATLNFTGWWDYRGTGKSIVSTGSHITAPAINVDGLTYPWVDFTGLAEPVISGTTFGQLTFTDVSVTSSVAIGVSNIIRRLEFKGRGALTGGGNSIDTLILAGSRNYTFTGTNTINKYLQAVSASCAGLSEIKGSPTGTLAFGSGAVANMSNIYMQNMTATGSITPIAFNGADAGGNIGWTITTAAAGARYWVGGAGDWNDPAHWSATSGGTPGACVPTVYDDVYFDANSGFTTSNKTVTVNNGNAYCHNVNWTGAPNSPTWSKGSWTIEVWGDSVILNPAATFSVAPITLKGANATFLKGGAPLGDFDVRIEKPGGSLTLLNDYNNAQTNFTLINGSFNAAGRALNISSIDNASLSNASSIDISNATITAGAWRYNGVTTNHSLNAANSTITTPGFTANGFTYNKVNVSSTAKNNASIAFTTIDSLVFTNTSTTSQAGIGNGSNNTLNYVEYKGSGGIYSTGNTIDTLVFFPGNTYTLDAGTNTTITGEWYGSGTPCRPTEIVSSSTTNATITKTAGQVDFDYVRLRRITAAGAAQPFIARKHSTDLGNNVNWNIEPYDGAAPIMGLGPDTAVFNEEFPITLKTEGFFASPSSTYLWSDNSTADTLLVSAPGTYGVSVSLADGCNINDQIVVGSLGWLPITITSFKASAAGCQAKLQWKIEDALNFNRFVVEQSKDGSHYTAIGQVLYTEGIDGYTYTDNNPGEGTTWYRLKLVDTDTKYEYSKVVSVRSDCANQQILVRPTVTSNTVQVVLPQGYEKAQLYILNTSGQRIVPVVQGNGTLRTVSLQGLPAAAYMLQVVNGGDSKTFLVIKQ